jgi:hypothetical protein
LPYSCERTCNTSVATSMQMGTPEPRLIVPWQIASASLAHSSVCFQKRLRNDAIVRS